MKEKRRIAGLPDVLLTAIVMTAAFFLPFVGYRYQKVNYTVSGFDLLKGFASEDGKVAYGAGNFGMILLLVCSILLIICGLI